jgi:Leucine-rich repeat (LRR) protein
VQLEGCALVHPWNALYERDSVLLVYLNDITVEALDLSDCGLRHVPESITRLQALRSLDLSRNELVALPSALAQLKHLVALSVDGNPLASHLSAILAKVCPCQAVHCILRQTHAMHRA